MKHFLRQNGIWILVIALLLSLVITLSSVLLGGSANPLSNAVQAVTAPIRGGISAVLDWAGGVSDYVFRYGEMQQELEDLRLQIAQLEEQVRQGEEDSRENEQLRELLNLQQQRQDFVFENARVTARSNSNWESTLTLSKGSAAGVAAGNYDVIASAVTITPERQKAFAFTVPYYDVRQIVVLRKGDSAENFEALKGRVVGGQIGTTGIFVAQKSGVDMTIREYDNVGLAMQDLLNSRIDAVICDSPVALYYANQKEGFADQLSIAFRTEATESFGFVVQKNRKDLVERLNKGIEAVRAKGIEAEIIRKWMGD